MKKVTVRNLRVLAGCIGVVLLAAALLTGCKGQIPIPNVITVTATLDGLPWQGPVSYNVTGTGLPTLSGISVNHFFSNLPAGNRTFNYVSGAPANAVYVNTTPAAPQPLTASGTISYVLHFKTSTNIIVKATYNGASWTGPLNYKLKGTLNLDWFASIFSFSFSLPFPDFSLLDPGNPLLDPSSPSFDPVLFASTLAAAFTPPAPSASTAPG